MSATFDFSDLVEAQRRLEAAPKDLTPTMQIIAGELVEHVHDLWDSAGRGTWAPYAPSTIAKKEAAGKPIAKPSKIPRDALGRFAAKGSASMLRMLFETGEAYGNVFPDAGPDFAEATDGTSYLAYHLGDGPHEKIPKRDPFELEEGIIDRAAEMVLKDVLQKMR